MKRMIAMCLAALMLLSLAACGKEKIEVPELDTDFTGRQVTYTFADNPAEYIMLSADGAAAVLETVASVQPDYTDKDLYQLGEVKSRLHFDASVENHAHNALDSAGNLTAAHLAELVKANNEAFLAEKPFGFENVKDEEYILGLCTVIVDTVNVMHELYPDIDWQRVYCNLGNLKILYDVGMLSYAQVNDKLVLAISKHNTSIVLNLKGEDAFRNVLVHETMHLIQIGCTCEQIENCTRRCGICIYWEDFKLNTTDWGWMFEGAAERNMCNLTGGKATTYQYKMDYLCSFTLSTMLREETQADTMETLHFYDDPERLFDAFGCETEEEREELLCAVIALNTFQMQPERFMDAYAEKYGMDLRQDEDAMNDFCYRTKIPVCTTLAREFFTNLTAYLQTEDVTTDDLFFLLNLFEGHMNQHLNFSVEYKKSINAPFVESYTTMRQALFDALETDHPELDFDTMYAEYQILDDENKLNASWTSLPTAKRRFLAERAQWQDELGALGVKIA